MTKSELPYLSAKNIVKDFGDNRVLDDVSIDIHSGDVISIIGPSGAGKSTFLRCINLLETPTTGVLSIGDFQISIGEGHKKAGKKELSTLRRNAGMVFQSFNLFPHLTVLENIALAQRRVLGRDKEEARTRSMELLDRVGLKDKPISTRADVPVVSSTSGNSALASARPKVMLLTTYFAWIPSGCGNSCVMRD